MTIRLHIHLTYDDSFDRPSAEMNVTVPYDLGAAIMRRWSGREPTEQPRSRRRASDSASTPYLRIGSA